MTSFAAAAPAAIRCLARILSDGVAYARTEGARKRKHEIVNFLQREYEAAPADEVVQEVHRGGEALGSGPGGTYYAKGHALNSLEGHGYDRIAMRSQRRARLFTPAPDAVGFPESWQARFYERVAWPRDESLHGEPLFRMFLEVRRGSWNLEIPVHDVRDPWIGATFKAKPPGSFPVELGFPFRGYVVAGERTSLQTLRRHLTVYLAQRSFLTPEEESEAIAAFFGRGSSDRTAAQHQAYQRAKRRYVQPMGGQPGFAQYLRRTEAFALRDLDIPFTIKTRGQGQSGTDDSESPDDPFGDVRQLAACPPDWLSLKQMRFAEPKLHRALLSRIKSGDVATCEWEDELFVRSNDAERVDAARTATAAERTKAPYSSVERVEWTRRLMNKGLARGSARRKLARWINVLGLSQTEIDAAIESGRAPRRNR